MKKKKKKKKTTEIPPDHHATAEIVGLLTLTFVVMMVLSLISFAYGHHANNWIGTVGNTLGWIFHTLFGITGYLVALYVGWIGWCLLFSKPIHYPRLRTFYFIVAIVSLSMLLSVGEDHFPQFRLWMEKLFYPRVPKSPSLYHLGGVPIYYIYHDMPLFNLQTIFNSMGVGIIFSSTLLVSLLFFCKVSIAEAVHKVTTLFTMLKEKATTSTKEQSSDFMRYVKLRMSNEPATATSHQNLLGIQPETDLTARPSLSRKQIPEQPSPIAQNIRPATPKVPPATRRQAALQAQRVHNGDFSSYRFPPLSLLTTPKKVDQTSLKQGLRRQAEVLEETLLSFGIEAKVGQINCGPTVTSFEVHPAIGVKVQRVLSLENDIALNMEAQAIRIIAPIPGKAAIGIEVPNPSPQEVSFKELMSAYQQQQKKLHIPILLGKTVTGDYVMSDLTKMPHMIIAGATGSGKSVCINTIIMSLLYNAKPDEIQVIMIDPKKVELTPYTNLPHLIAPVITEPHGAYTAMQWLVKEMETRYEILKQVGVRNAEGFNNRKIDREREEALSIEIPERFPYIVGIIDELADLMMVSSSDIETPIARIAQMARAVGIHLILATQRPSREVITGLIKANFPARIAFKVSSRVNSQIILDSVGAESLLGNGDMLFLPPGTSQLLRAQGAFISDEDIHNVVNFICEQAPPNYRIQSFDKMASLEDGGGLGGNGRGSGDEIYDQALDVVLSTGNASTTFLQRKLKIGYARAAGLMDELEAAGIVTPQEGSKSRRVIYPDSGDDQE